MSTDDAVASPPADLADGPWSWAECRLAARRVRKAERGAAAIRLLRGRGVDRMGAERAPLSVLLWLASRQDRLVTTPGGALAVLRPPLRTADEQHATFHDDGTTPGAATSAARWSLAKLDRHWQHAAIVAPIVALLVAALLVAVALPWRHATTTAVLMVLAGMVGVVVLLGIGAVRAGGDVHADLDGRRTVRTATTSRATSQSWTVPLLHCENVVDTSALLDHVIRRHETAKRHGVVLVHRAGVTTAGALAAAEASRLVTTPNQEAFDDVLVLIRRANSVSSPPTAHEAVARAAGGFTVVAGGILASVPMLAIVLSWADGAVCAGQACTPASYTQTLMWTADQFLPFGGPAPDVRAASPHGWLMGELVAIMGLVFVGVVFAAIAEVRRFNRDIGVFTDAQLSVELSAAEREQFGGVFLNYRVTGSRPAVRLLRDSLLEVFHQDKVFLDEESMAPGDVYPERLRTGLRDSEVLVVVIHPGWLAALKEPGDDWVQREIAESLSTGKRIVPVLLDGATMPGPDELPTGIEEFGLRQAAAIRADSAGRDVATLVGHIAAVARRRPDDASDRAS